MLAKSARLSKNDRAELQKRDYARWMHEYESRSKDPQALVGQRRLMAGNVQVSLVSVDEYKTEAQADGDTYWVLHQNDPGQAYNLFYRLDYPSASTAPSLSALDGLRSPRKIKSVIVRVQVSRRPDVSASRSWLLGWDFLDALAPAFPFRILFTPPLPEQVWMVRFSLAVDKLYLKEY
jgi:hypothetical protein